MFGVLIVCRVKRLIDLLFSVCLGERDSSSIELLVDNRFCSCVNRSTKRRLKSNIMELILDHSIPSSTSVRSAL